MAAVRTSLFGFTISKTEKGLIFEKRKIYIFFCFSFKGFPRKKENYLYIIDCKIDENGVAPMPVAIRTACSARKIFDAGAPKGPSISI